jgi:hypothetical protein
MIRMRTTARMIQNTRTSRQCPQSSSASRLTAWRFRVFDLHPMRCRNCKNQSKKPTPTAMTSNSGTRCKKPSKEGAWNDKAPCRALASVKMVSAEKIMNVTNVVIVMDKRALRFFRYLGMYLCSADEA